MKYVNSRHWSIKAGLILILVGGGGLKYVDVIVLCDSFSTLMATCDAR